VLQAAETVVEHRVYERQIGLATIRVGTMTARDDEENQLRDLMIRYQQGDADAVERLVTALSPRLYRFLGSPQSSREENEDLLQECWMRIHRSRQTYRASEPLLPWVFAIARHSRLDAYRRRRRRASREILVSEPPDIPRWDAEAGPHDAGDLSALVEQLPEEQREVILMLKVSGMSVAEVARATQSTTGAVKQKAHRAYKKLRKWLGSDREQTQ
jgi:RNA polymerase sigma-70 factor (ECF subfamily)